MNLCQEKLDAYSGCSSCRLMAVSSTLRKRSALLSALFSGERAAVPDSDSWSSSSRRFLIAASYKQELALGTFIDPGGHGLYLIMEANSDVIVHEANVAILFDNLASRFIRRFGDAFYFYG